MERQTIDCRGRQYTMFLIPLVKAMKTAAPGTEFEVLGDYSSFEKELRNWCQKMNHEIKEISTEDGVTRAVIVKG